MSYPNLPNLTPTVSLTRSDVVNMLYSAVAMEELGLAHIINAEGEKIQYALGTLAGVSGPAATLQDILNVNANVQSMMDTVFRQEMMLESRLRTVADIPTEPGATGIAGPTGLPGLVSSVNGLTGDVVLEAGSGVFPVNLSLPSDGTLGSYTAPGVYSSNAAGGPPPDGPTAPAPANPSVWTLYVSASGNVIQQLYLSNPSLYYRVYNPSAGGWSIWERIGSIRPTGETGSGIICSSDVITCLRSLEWGRTLTERDRSFCFITCVSDDGQYRNCLNHIRRLFVPEGYRVDAMAIRNAPGLASGYNAGVRASGAKYKIYLHQDVRIANRMLLHDLLRLFQKHARLGLVGVAGCGRIPASGVWWEASELYGKVLERRSTFGYLSFREVEGDFQPVDAVDGLFMATQYDVPWREDVFDGWHFYDVSQCFEFRKRGYAVGVPSQRDAWIVHECGEQDHDPEYERYRVKFVQHYFV